MELTEEDFAKIKRQFLVLDKDGNEELSFDELSDILKDPKLKMSPEDVRSLMDEFDLDENGTIDALEFLVLMENKKNRELIHRAIILRTRIRQAFKELDIDGNGYISRKEFTSIIRKQGGKFTLRQVNAMIARADINGDGKIDYDEFVICMTK